MVHRQFKNPQYGEASQTARQGHTRAPAQPVNARARSGSTSREARGSVERGPHTDVARKGRRFVGLHQWLVQATHHKNTGDSHRCSSQTHHRATHWSLVGLPHSSTSVRCTPAALRGATRAGRSRVRTSRVQPRRGERHAPAGDQTCTSLAAPAAESVHECVSGRVITESKECFHLIARSRGDYSYLRYVLSRVS